MKISDLVGEIIYGHNLSRWNYDVSMSLEDLAKFNLPYAMACVEINENSMIAVDVGQMPPVEFIELNQNTEFMLDPNLPPRNLDTMMGNKNVYYLKRNPGPFEEDDKLWGQFTIVGFKERGNVTTARLPGSYSPVMVDAAFEEIKKMLHTVQNDFPNKQPEQQNIPYLKKMFSFKTKESVSSNIGAFQIQVSFLNHDDRYPNKYHETTLSSSGFTYAEVVKLIKEINQSEANRYR